MDEKIIRRRRARLAALAATAAAVGLMWPAGAHASQLGDSQLGDSQLSDLASHPYRHGLVPTVDATVPNLGLNNLSYGGGVSGVGVTTGAEKVYLVFWGSQWGSSSTNASGYTTLSGDPQQTAPILQGFFKGLGTGSETWSGVMTQYCQGVTSGSTTCPAGSAHVGYPTGGALAGVWVDTSAAAPAQATGNQLAAEAVAAPGTSATPPRPRIAMRST